MTPITPGQWRKVLKALYYSFASGFIVGLTTSLTGVMTNFANGSAINLGKSLLMGLIIAGLVSGVNTALVTIKQLFTPPN